MRSFFPLLALPLSLCAADPLAKLPPDPNQSQERTCFQTGGKWLGNVNLPADVSMTYGIDRSLPERVKSWKEHGFIVHLMTGVAWGQYQDYLFGRFDGINHMDEIQQDVTGKKHDHGKGDVYYMVPSENYGKMLAAGVQRGLDAGAEAIHLEEPEFWVKDGYGEGFKRQWELYYHEPWQDQASSPDAQWRSSKLKYYLYRHALQQVFDYVQAYNKRTGRHVRCYVATHSLLNYSYWGIVSPESSLAQLKGCDGYIAQVWTDTERLPNYYKGVSRERVFDTGFLEFGAMQNMVRSTGRRVWFLADPVEDVPKYTWREYQQCWETTIVASLFQPEVWRYEVAPWPKRIFQYKYPSEKNPAVRERIPPAYATTLQTVMHSLNDMNQPHVSWDCGTPGFGVLIGDSLMFQRGAPHASDKEMSHVYSLALPFLKHGMPVTPVQLENVALKHYLDPFRVLFLTYQGMKPLSPDVNTALADWVKAGGTLVVWDDDSDPYNSVREWWNSGHFHYATPREHLFEQLGLSSNTPTPAQVGKGNVFWIRENPVDTARDPDGDARVMAIAKAAAGDAGLKWKETNWLMLRRGPYVIAAGMEDSPVHGIKEIHGHFIDLFSADLALLKSVKIAPGTYWYLLDLDALKPQKPRVLAASGFARPIRQNDRELTLGVAGIDNTPGIVLVYAPSAPASITLDGTPVKGAEYSSTDHLLRIRFANGSRPKELSVRF